MYKFLIAFLVSMAASQCPDISAKYLKHGLILTCESEPDSDECARITDEFFEDSALCLVESEILTTSQGLVDFVEGFYNGVQVNAQTPSSCVKSFVLVKGTYRSFINGFNQIGFTPLVQSLYTFNSMVNQVSNTYSLCKFSELYNILHANITETIVSVAVHVSFDPSEAGTYYNNFQKYLSSKNYVSSGINLGKLFSLVTGFYL